MTRPVEKLNITFRTVDKQKNTFGTVCIFGLYYRRILFVAIALEKSLCYLLGRMLALTTAFLYLS